MVDNEKLVRGIKFLSLFLLNYTSCTSVIIQRLAGKGPYNFDLFSFGLLSLQT